MAISVAKKKRIWDRSEHRCSYCRRPLKLEEMTIDHIVPSSTFKKSSDADAEENLCAACRKCNVAKAAMTVKEFRKWVNTKNNELLKLEADLRSAIALSEELSKQIESKKYDYIHHLRGVIGV